jgi:hypothetical protein
MTNRSSRPELVCDSCEVGWAISAGGQCWLCGADGSVNSYGDSDEEQANALLAKLTSGLVIKNKNG